MSAVLNMYCHLIFTKPTYEGSTSLIPIVQIGLLRQRVLKTSQDYLVNKYSAGISTWAVWFQSSHSEPLYTILRTDRVELILFQCNTIWRDRRRLRC